MGIGSRKFKGSDGFLRKANPDNYVARERAPVDVTFTSDQSAPGAPPAQTELQGLSVAPIMPATPQVIQNVPAVAPAANAAPIAIEPNLLSSNPTLSEEALLDFLGTTAPTTYDELKAKFAPTDVIQFDSLIEKLQANSAISVTNLDTRELGITEIGERARKYLKLAKL